MTDSIFFTDPSGDKKFETVDKYNCSLKALRIRGKVIPFI